MIIKEDEMGGTCSMHDEIKIAYKILVGKQGRDSLENLSVDGRIMLRWFLKTGLNSENWVQLAQDRDQWHLL
jgi:hypothetical protein